MKEKTEHFEAVASKSLRSRSSNSRYFQNALGLANLKVKLGGFGSYLRSFLTVIACLIAIGCEARVEENQIDRYISISIYQHIDSVATMVDKIPDIHPIALILGLLSIICNFGYLLFPDPKNDE